MCDKRYCKDCERFYGESYNQCNIPTCGLKPKDTDENIKLEKATGIEHADVSIEVDVEGIKFIKTHEGNYGVNFSSDKSHIFGHPTELNINNDCYFYLPKKTQSEKKQKVDVTKIENRQKLIVTVTWWVLVFSSISFLIGFIIGNIKY